VAADRWSDAISAVRSAARAGWGRGDADNAGARLLAVQTRKHCVGRTCGRFREPANELAQAALFDLIGRGEVSQVVTS
jgi:hypothetical protein